MPALLTAGQLAGRCVELINTRDRERAAQVCAPDFVTLDPHGHDHAPEGVAHGPEVFANVVDYLHRIFDGLHLEIVETYDVGDRAATVLRLTGRYVGNERTASPGKPVSVEQVHFWHSRDGKLFKHRFMENDAEFDRQVG